MEMIKKLPREKSPGGHSVSVALFKCSRCGNISKKQITKGKKQKTCGCKKREINGDSKTRLYWIWQGMKNRCNNVNEPRYDDYGGRGVVMWGEWERDFLSFKKWALENGYSDELQIDRRNNEGHYAPGNCRFVTPVQNSRNRRNNKLNWVMVDAVRDLRKSGLKIKELSKIFGVRENYVSRITQNDAWVYKK